MGAEREKELDEVVDAVSDGGAEGCDGEVEEVEGEDLTTKKARYDAWIRTRRIGFASFIIPVSIITTLLCFWANDIVY